MPPTVQQLYGHPKVGGDVLCFCTRCKMELAHVIVSMVDRHPSKVLCKTCKSQRIYRPGAPRRNPVKASKPAKVTIRASEMWEKKMAEGKPVEALPYNVKTTYLKANLIVHPVFGMGFVEEVKRHNKIVVFFRDGEKTLVHGIYADGAESQEENPS